MNIGEAEKHLRGNGEKKEESRARRSRAYALLFPRGNAADGTAENMDVSLAVRTLEKARDKIAFLGYGFFADRADASDRFLGVGVAMGTAEDVADPVGFAGVERGLELFAARENRFADRADPRFPDIAARESLFGRVGSSSRGEESIRENEKKDPDENQDYEIKGRRYHGYIMHRNLPCRNPESGLSFNSGNIVRRGDPDREPGGYNLPGLGDI
jgi:hypothetical protein